MNGPSNPSTHGSTSSLVASYLDNCKARGLAKESMRFYREFLTKFSDMYPELPEAPEPVQDFIIKFQSSDARRHAAFRACRSFYNWLERRYTIVNPIRMVGAPLVRPTERPSLTLDQLRRLLEYPGHSPLVRVLLHFLADTGVRIGEAANLKAEDILENGVRVTGKTGARIIPISPTVGAMLSAISAGSGKIFRYNAATLSDYVGKAGKAAGVPCHAHDLRRTFAVNWRGSDLSLAHIGGWRSMRMVDHYSGKGRRGEKAAADHKNFSPIAQLYGQETEPSHHFLTAQPAQAPAGRELLDHVADLAEKLGLARGELELQKRRADRAENGRGPKLDDLQQIIKDYAGVDPLIPLAKFVYHGCLYHFFQSVLGHAETIAKDGLIPLGLVRSLQSLAEGEFAPGESHTQEELLKAMRMESRKLFSIVTALFRSQVLVHQTEALIYKNLLDDDDGEDLEKLNLMELH